MIYPVDSVIQPLNNRGQRGKLEESINKVSANALNRKNPGAMESNIDMAKHIKHLKKPEDHQATYATNVTFVADAIVDNNTLIDTKIEASEEASIRAAQSENVFLKVMDDLFKEDDDDIHKVGVIDKDYQSEPQNLFIQNRL